MIRYGIDVKTIIGLKTHLFASRFFEARISVAFIKVNLIFLFPKLDLFTEERWKCKKIRGERIPASKLV